MTNSKDSGMKSLKVLPCIYLERLKKITKCLSYYSRPPSRDLNPSPSENGTVVPTVRQRYSVCYYFVLQIPVKINSVKLSGFHL
jgi:hypothetical protein